MRVTKEKVVQAASAIADEKGFNNVTLKAVAEKLNMRTPSLYNHIDSLENLLREVAHNGMRSMNERMTKVAIGNYGDSAIKSVAIEYLDYMILHPGIYETIQWAVWNGTVETTMIYNDYISILTILIDSCKFERENTHEILNLLTAVIHGYTTLQLRNAFANPDDVKIRLSSALDIVLLGLRQKYSE